ncbi:MAG: hypothetical protein LN414_03275 [Candidatus Thermoplasmatota archaeon]|nr:hypothetical protein [Candidatus Thermoplasmatota archaeon]
MKVPPTYCGYDDVENMTGIGPSSSIVITQVILEALIDHAEGEIEGWLAELGQAGDATNSTLKTATVELSIAALATRLRMSNVKPSQLTLGEKTMIDNVDNIVAEKNAKARALVESYVLRKQGRPMVETSVDAEATIVRGDSMMSDMQLDQQEVTEYHDRENEVTN